MIKQNKINKFVSLITKEAEDQKLSIEAETKEIIDKEIQTAEDEALRECYDYMKQKTLELEKNNGNELSQQLYEYNKKVILHRNQISDSIFNSVSEKLYSFCKTKAYEEFISRSIKNALLKLNDKTLTVFIKPGDVTAATVVQKACSGISLKEDPSIIIGGLSAINADGTIFINDTLDARFDEQKRWFSENSGLTISD
ncbi:MAG: V-type ATP synthase subunit E [bacterium]|nr:V-type ATP synthase subunit E [bacterium]